jgi:glycosyltransferase involved in cell wall biosynthesis
MTLTILNVAYPFAPVGPDAVGGAEQILSALDRALVRAGHSSVVVASEGSIVEGAFVPVPATPGPLDADRMAAARARHRRAIEQALERYPVDVVHCHGLDFHSYLPPPGVPVLATLHLPVRWYSQGALQPQRPDTWLQCVSETQHAMCGANPHLLPPIENGVPIQALSGRHTKHRFALMLSRICPEKGVHIAVDAAKLADTSLVIAGAVFPYSEHERYFFDEVRPRLDSARRFIGPVGFSRKRWLLASARCLLVPSLVPETSSLAAREALAAGTPVIAFRQGALADTVEHGRTGFLVDDEEGMAEAIRNAESIDPEACRQVARERFSLDRMVRQYFAAYEQLSQGSVGRQVSGAA